VNVRADLPDAAARIDLLIRERVRLASFALAPSRDLLRRCADGGVLTMPSVGAPPHPAKVASWGADAILVQGGEGGGHTGPVPTTLLLPQVVDAVDIPVVAAGGFFDGRGLVAALAYGAAGVAMGTRFLLTSDSPVGADVKRLYLDAPVTGTVVTTRVDGVPHRVLRTPFVDALEGSGRITGFARAIRHAAAFRKLSGRSWPALLRAGAAARHGRELTWQQAVLAAGTPVLLRTAMVEGRPDCGVLPAGQVVGLIDDLPSCAELIDRVMTEADERLARLTAFR
jgi:NAD(P)H-dependent flavin oxidoreductase YrpB (nitropropane dioxygenase family)